MPPTAVTARTVEVPRPLMAPTPQQRDPAQENSCMAPTADGVEYFPTGKRPARHRRPLASSIANGADQENIPARHRRPMASNIARQEHNELPTDHKEEKKAAEENNTMTSPHAPRKAPEAPTDPEELKELRRQQGHASYTKNQRNELPKATRPTTNQGTRAEVTATQTSRRHSSQGRRAPPPAPKAAPPPCMAQPLDLTFRRPSSQRRPPPNETMDHYRNEGNAKDLWTRDTAASGADCQKGLKTNLLHHCSR